MRNRWLMTQFEARTQSDAGEARRLPCWFEARTQSDTGGTRRFPCIGSLLLTSELLCLTFCAGNLLN